MQATTVWRPRGLPDLNFDILLQIISLLTPRDVAHLTRTCHALRRALSAELPRGGVTLEGRHLTSFLAFTNVKHGKDRLSYFQELVLPGSTYETMSSGDQTMSLKDVKRALSTILLAASNLESLSILDLDTFSFPPQELKTILDLLPRLRELEMSGIQKKYQGVLVDVLPRLRTLGLDFLEESHPNVFLKAHQINLQEVTLYNATLKGVSLSLPSVQTLRACPANFPSDIDALTRIFPNVKDLTIDFPRNVARLDPEYRKDVRRYHVGVASLAWTDPYVKSWRDRLLGRPQRKADAWPHIQSLRAAGVGMEKIGWLGLTCQVPRMEVCSWHMAQTQLAGMLRELRPSCLVFHPGTFHGHWVNRSYGWGLLFALQVASSVTRLAIVLCKETMGFVSRDVRWLVRLIWWGCPICQIIINVSRFVGDLLLISGEVFRFLPPTPTSV
ncbi:hypothetical protein LXA43DRAFT_95821 [Ganoderma leucocontextum]|nr:hypothetical protein LXA43DRAFT_95821 [Ganoderma leucocontextum]